ncbi:MAG: adenylate kinase [Gemmatimonadota bacterium]
MVVILLGPPGVGKGTQGALLAKSVGWDRLVTGDLLRAARREGTELGKRAQSYMDRGDLVPDDVIVALVKEHLKELPEERGVIFDGFPRTLPQAEALAKALPEVGREVDGVLLLEAPDEVLVKRIAGRRSCPQCGRVFNVHFDPPVTEGVCDECGALLDHRSDDTPETVRHRLEVYREMTEPLVRYYEKSEAPVLQVDGDRAPELVRKALWQALVESLDVDAV